MPEAADNPDRHRYEMAVGGKTAFVTYARRAHNIVLKHTEVPPALEGQGVGSALARSVLRDIRRRGLKVVPECAFIAAFIACHPEFADIVAEPDAGP
nr:GNAT family N-acetyltransferase [uncultured Rhodopila sp.]